MRNEQEYFPKVIAKVEMNSKETSSLNNGTSEHQ
jgi:hypothetical protein